MTATTDEQTIKALSDLEKTVSGLLDRAQNLSQTAKTVENSIKEKQKENTTILGRIQFEQQALIAIHKDRTEIESIHAQFYEDKQQIQCKLAQTNQSINQFEQDWSTFQTRLDVAKQVQAHVTDLHDHIQKRATSVEQHQQRTQQDVFQVQKIADSLRSYDIEMTARIASNQQTQQKVESAQRQVEQHLIQVEHYTHQSEELSKIVQNKAVSIAVFEQKLEEFRQSFEEKIDQLEQANKVVQDNQNHSTELINQLENTYQTISNTLLAWEHQWNNLDTKQDKMNDILIDLDYRLRKLQALVSWFWKWRFAIGIATTATMIGIAGGMALMLRGV